MAYTYSTTDFHAKQEEALKHEQAWYHQEIDRMFDVKTKGNFNVKLTKAQAKKLSQCSSFKYSVAQKGYKTYTITDTISK
ncbi:hypothetical protein ABMB44_13255 [Levilactobacillus brevis]